MTSPPSSPAFSMRQNAATRGIAGPGSPCCTATAPRSTRSPLRLPARPHRHRDLRFRARPEVPVEGSLVILRQGRPRRRELGQRAGGQDPARQGRPGRGRDPPPCHHIRLLARRARRRRHLRRLPHRQESVPGLRHCPRRRLANRHRGNRGRLPSPGQRQNGHHRGQMGTRRSRGHPQAPRPHHQRYWRYHLRREHERVHNARYPETSSSPRSDQLTLKERHPYTLLVGKYCVRR